MRGDPIDQQWWGDRLGAAHRALAGFDHPGLRRWNWLQLEAPHLAVQEWLRPALADAVAAMIRLTVTDRLTYGVLHGDPAPHDFVLDPDTGRAGLLDWGACGTGPLVYDVATAVVYAGGPDASAELLDGYLAAGPVQPGRVGGCPAGAAALPVGGAGRLVRPATARGPGADDWTAADPLRAAREALESLTGGCLP